MQLPWYTQISRETKLKEVGVGNKINLETDVGWRSNFLPCTDNTLY